MFEFRALIEEAHGEGGTWVQVPPSVVEGLGQTHKSGRAGRIPVRATFNGFPYRGSIVSMGGDAMAIGILKDIRRSLGKKVGDEVLVTLEHDDAPREVDIPDDLARALRSAGLSDAFEKLSHTRRKKIVGGAAGAKRPETRQKRIDNAIQELGT